MRLWAARSKSFEKLGEGILLVLAMATFVGNSCTQRIHRYV
jgi:hypothetical protein